MPKRDKTTQKSQDKRKRDPKPAKTRQNEPKQPGTSQNDLKGNLKPPKVNQIKPRGALKWTTTTEDKSKQGK